MSSSPTLKGRYKKKQDIRFTQEKLKKLDEGLRQKILKL
jgi:hypothetical protein